MVSGVGNGAYVPLGCSAFTGGLTNVMIATPSGDISSVVRGSFIVFLVMSEMETNTLPVGRLRFVWPPIRVLYMYNNKK